MLLVFLRLGLTSFGGPAAHLGYFREAFIERLGGGSVYDPVTAELNDNLRDIGVASPDYKDGDYVLTLSFRTSVSLNDVPRCPGGRF